MSFVSTVNLEKKSEYENEELIDEDDDEEEIEDDDEEVEEEEDEEGDDHIPVTVSRRTGRGLTLKTLLKEGILESGVGFMTINYLGNKFKGDLLPDGRIRSQETNKIFGTPSAWAIFCKKIVNPEKKSGCGWASVRYRGKKLDSYKNNWFRQKRLEDEKEDEEMVDESGSEGDVELGGQQIVLQESEIIEFETLGNRNAKHNRSSMVELSTFQSLSRLQPFNVTMSSSAMAVIDVHGHLTTSEVVGYLAGQWDVNNHNLIVSHAFPVRCRLGDSENGSKIEEDLYSEMARLKLTLVGWYHTHPSAPPLPSLYDVDSQLDYQMKMKGYSDATYTPILGIITSPFEKAPLRKKGIPHRNGNAIGFWVMPPAENKPLEYGKPMSILFNVVQDAFIPKEALVHMTEVVRYYQNAPDAVDLTASFDENFTYWQKLKESLRGRVPSDHFQPLIEFIIKIVDKNLPEETFDPQPVSGSSMLEPSPNHITPSPSLNVVESKENKYVSITKDLESYVSNLMKSSGSVDFAAISNSSSLKKDEALEESVTSAIPMSTDELTKQILKHSNSRFQSGKSPLNSSVSQTSHPLVSSESEKRKNENLPSRLLSSEIEEGKMDVTYSDTSIPSSSRYFSESKLPFVIPGTNLAAYSDIMLEQRKMENSSAIGYSDLKRKTMEDDKTNRELDNFRQHFKGKSVPPADLSLWLSHNKSSRDKSISPTYDNEPSLYRSLSSNKDIANVISSSDFLLSKFHSSASFPFHSPLNVASDSRPTYHSEFLPLFHSKQDKDSSTNVVENGNTKNIKDMQEFGMAEVTISEFKSRKENKNLRKPQEFDNLDKEKKFHDKCETAVFKEPRGFDEKYLKEASEIDFKTASGEKPRDSKDLTFDSPMYYGKSEEFQTILPSGRKDRELTDSTESVRNAKSWIFDASKSSLPDNKLNLLNTSKAQSYSEGTGIRPDESAFSVDLSQAIPIDMTCKMKRDVKQSEEQVQQKSRFMEHDQPFRLTSHGSGSKCERMEEDSTCLSNLSEDRKPT